MWVGNLSRYDAWSSFNSTVIKILGYPLLGLTLTEAACITIISPLLSGGLPSMGINRPMTRSLIYTPLKYQGLIINEFYTTQDLVYLTTIINYIWKGTEIGKLLRISLGYIKIELGIR